MPRTVPDMRLCAHANPGGLIPHSLYRDGRQVENRNLPAADNPRHSLILKNRTALFNIASIFSLSMLFSKNSGKIPGPL